MRIADRIVAVVMVSMGGCAPAPVAEPVVPPDAADPTPPVPAFAGTTVFVREEPELWRLFEIENAMILSESWLVPREGDSLLHCYRGNFEHAGDAERDAAIRRYLSENGFEIEAPRDNIAPEDEIKANKENTEFHWHRAFGKRTDSWFLRWCEAHPDMAPADAPTDFLPDDPRFREILVVAEALGGRTMLSVEWWPDTELLIEARGTPEDPVAAAQWLSDHGFGKPEPNAETLTSAERSGGIQSDVRLDTGQKNVWTVFLRLPDAPNPWRAQPIAWKR
jgi:hypothetical protein